MKQNIFAVLALSIGCAGCVIAPQAPLPERLTLNGALDLSGQGVGFMLTNVSGLACEGRYASGRLPDPVLVAVACNDQRSGELTVMKTEGMRGTIVLSDGKQGDVIFELPAPAVVKPPPHIVRTRVATVHYVRHGRGGCGSRGGPGYRLPNGKCASHRRHHH